MIHEISSCFLFFVFWKLISYSIVNIDKVKNLQQWRIRCVLIEKAYLFLCQTDKLESSAEFSKKKNIKTREKDLSDCWTIKQELKQRGRAEKLSD